MRCKAVKNLAQETFKSLPVYSNMGIILFRDYIFTDHLIIL